MKKNFSAAQGLVEYAVLIVLVALVLIPVLATLNPAIGRTFHNIVDGVVNNDVRNLGSRLTQTVMAATRSSTPTNTPVGGGATATMTPPATATNTLIPTATPSNTPTITQTFTATPPGGWIWCANENGTCTFTGTRLVRYGANSTWVTLTFTNSTPCTNAVFTDPLVGTAKTCWYFDTSVYPTATPTLTPTPLPTILSITPNNGSTAGGTSITISGSSFIPGGTSVTMGGVAVTPVTCTATSCTLTTPAHAAGAVDVAVTAGTYTVTMVGGYTFVTPPVITGVSPNAGTVAGGTTITISGSGFNTNAGLNNFAFSGTAFTASSCTTTSCTATTPANSAGGVNLTITVPGGLFYTLNNAYTYMAPSVTGVSPASGTTAGGTAVTITGNYFAPGATTFTFDGVAATGITCSSATSCTATTPAGAVGPANVTATVSSLSGTLSGGFTYTVATPTVTSVSPNSGVAAGGTSVTIVGTNFSTTGTTFTFGGNAATGVTCSSTTSCTATTPAGTTGAVDVTATVSGMSGTRTNGFTYNAPTITAISPISGTTDGGTVITITGTGFSTTSTTFTAGTAMTGVTCTSTTSCTATTPARSAGAVSIRATVSGQTSPNTAADNFTFVAPLTCTRTRSSVNASQGYYYVFTTTVYGNMTVQWVTIAGKTATIGIYLNQPTNFTGGNPVSVNPATPANRLNPSFTPGSGTLTSTVTNLAPTTYTVYFYSIITQGNTTNLSVTFMGTACPSGWN